MLTLVRSVLTLLATLSTGADGKVVSDRVKLRMNYADLAKWEPNRKVMMDGLHYATHFACNIGRCDWKVRIRAINPARALNRANNNKDYVVDKAKFSPIQEFGIHRFFDLSDSIATEKHAADHQAAINMRVILDSEWNAKGLGRNSFTAKMSGNECMGDIDSRLTRELKIPLNGAWSKSYSGALLQKSRPHHWYFVFEDCTGNWLDEFTKTYGIKPHAYLPSLTFEYEMTMTNTDGSHFGFELYGMPLVTFVSGALSSCLFAYFIYYQIVVLRGSEKRHPIIQAVNIALASKVIYFWAHYAHLITFKGDGIGLTFIDGFGSFIRAVGNIILIITVFSVSLGYSLNLPEMTMPGEAFIALATCYGFVEVLLSFAQYKTNSLRYHIHAAEGVIPVIIGVFRSLFAAMFVIACEHTKNRDDVTNESVIIFLNKFKWRGMLMMASGPTIVVLCSMILPHYQQNRYMETLSMIAEFATVIYLAVAFLSSKTSYFKASVMGNSLLPFGGGGGGSGMRQFGRHERRD